jgi:prephenate dehydrogenase
MDEPGFLSSSRVAILGLGLMGGSLALALRGRCAELLGVDPDPETLRLARERQVVDKAIAGPAEFLPQADLIVLAAPVGVILNLIPTLPALHPGPAFVIDLGSTKTRICQALERLPERFETVGGHPMCGKETLSLANADPLLYNEAPFAFTPLAGTTERARQVAEELAQAVGAHPLWLDAESHDRWVAAPPPPPGRQCPGRATPLKLASGGTWFSQHYRLASPDQHDVDILETNR